MSPLNIVAKGLCCDPLSGSHYVVIHYRCANLNKTVCMPYQNFLSFLVRSVSPTHSRLDNDVWSSLFVCFGAAAPRGPGPPHSLGF